MTFDFCNPWLLTFIWRSRMTSTGRSDFWGVTLMSEFVGDVIWSDFWLLQNFDFYVTFEDIIGQIMNLGYFTKKSDFWRLFWGENQSFLMTQTVSMTITGNSLTFLFVGRWLPSHLSNFRVTKYFNFYVKGILFSIKVASLQ